MGKVSERTNRNLLLFSSTSYTPDEDFDLVVDALKLVNDQLNKNNKNYNGPGIHLVVTGKGPLKAEFQEKFNQWNEELEHVQIETMWLEIEDYPKLVGSADLGVCLHYSSSGVDLPMKVVDMFSARLGKTYIIM
jgi:beta-1,4-mannosyltransferase